MKNQVKKIRVFLREFPLDNLLKLEAGILTGKVRYCDHETCLIGYFGGNTFDGYTKTVDSNVFGALARAAENEFLNLGNGSEYFDPCRLGSLPHNPYTKNLDEGQRSSMQYRDLYRSATLLRLVVDELERRAEQINRARELALNA